MEPGEGPTEKAQTRQRHLAKIRQALGTYKGQSQVERQFHHLKGPLAVGTMFLEKPERMSGLICILVWALTILALMERQVRSGLKGKAMYGLYPENRPSSSPTGPAILEREKGDRSNLCEAPSGLFRQIGPVPFPLSVQGHLPGALAIR